MKSKKLKLEFIKQDIYIIGDIKARPCMDSHNLEVRWPITIYLLAGYYHSCIYAYVQN